MKKILYVFSLLIVVWGCDYREYPQEEEWKEDFMEKQEEENGEREINFTPGNF